MDNAAGPYTSNSSAWVAGASMARDEAMMKLIEGHGKELESILSVLEKSADVTEQMIKRIIELEKAVAELVLKDKLT